MVFHGPVFIALAALAAVVGAAIGLGLVILRDGRAGRRARGSR